MFLTQEPPITQALRLNFAYDINNPVGLSSDPSESLREGSSFDSQSSSVSLVICSFILPGPKDPDITTQGTSSGQSATPGPGRAIIHRSLMVTDDI